MTEELHVEAHQSFIKTPVQLVVVILASFLVPISIIVAISQYVTSGLDTSPSNPLMAEDAVAKRIKPRARWSWARHRRPRRHQRLPPPRRPVLWTARPSTTRPVPPAMAPA